MEKITNLVLLSESEGCKIYYFPIDYTTLRKPKNIEHPHYSGDNLLFNRNLDL